MKKNEIILLALSIMLCLTFSSCRKLESIKGQGPVVTQSFDLQDISGVALSIDANVIITHGDTQSVSISGQQNIINNIEKNIYNGLWRIDYFYNVRKHTGVTIIITTTEMNYVTISGSGNVESTNVFPDSANVDLKISGSGNISFSTIAKSIDSEISGSGGMYLSGSAVEHIIKISGSGNVFAFGLDTYNTSVIISGSGNCKVLAGNLLNVTISGSGNVYYKGNPQIQANISGSGGVFDQN